MYYTLHQVLHVTSHTECYIMYCTLHHMQYVTLWIYLL